MIAQGSVDCINGALCNIVWGAVSGAPKNGFWGSIRTGQVVGDGQLDELQDGRGVDCGVWRGWGVVHVPLRGWERETGGEKTEAWWENI